MSLYDQKQLAVQPEFQARVAGAAVHTAIARLNGGTNEQQTLTVTGSPTGGSFTVASLPGSQVIQQNGTTASAAATVTGLSSTVGLFVGMSVTGQGVAAGATIASITSLTAITLSANSSASATVPLTFSGTPVASVNFNASAADVQATLQALSNIGVGNVVCTGGPLPGTPIVITFQGTLGNRPQKLLTLGTNSLTGGSGPTASFSRTTAGVNVLASDVSLANKVLNNPTGYGVLMAWGIADNATVQADFPGPNYQLGTTETTASSDIQFQMNSIFSQYGP